MNFLIHRFVNHSRTVALMLLAALLTAANVHAQSRGFKSQTEAGEASSIQFGNYHALIIAVENYDDRSINDLDHPVNDARRLKNVLQKHYTFEEENIQFLENPDRRSILKAFSDLRKNLTTEDNLLVFYAGHGFWDEGLEQGFWLPRDARQDDESDWISNSDIKDRIRSIKTQHTLLISDACFSGGIFKTRDAFIKPNISFQKVYEMPSRKGMTSGNLKTVPDKSVFVDYLVKRLEQNKDPYLYTEKLYVNMKDAVTNNSPNNQTPLYGVINNSGDEGGDFIFVRRPVTVAFALVISSQPVGAEVYIDGQYYGNSPYEANLAMGSYQVEVKASGYDDFSTTVDLVADASVKAGLRESLFELTIISNPVSGAKVFIGGMEQEGKTTFSRKMRSGTYEIELVAEGYDAWKGTVLVDKNTAVVADLTRPGDQAAMANNPESRFVKTATTDMVPPEPNIEPVKKERSLVGKVVYLPFAAVGLTWDVSMFFLWGTVDLIFWTLDLIWIFN